MSLLPRTFALVALVASAQAAIPVLRHGAPRLGESCQLTLEGVTPGAALVLLQSPLAAQVATPYGLLELERSASTLLAQGQADASGAWSVTVTLPADLALAEQPWHLQALVRGAGAPQLSNAVHLRWVGSRAYVACLGGLAGERLVDGGLSIVSLVQDARIASVDYGFVAGGSTIPAEPVLQANLAVGAIQASPTQLVLFDPFFGGVRAVLPFESAARTLHADASGTRLYVLDGVSSNGGTGARIHVLDLASGGTLATIALSGAAHTDQWTVDPARALAYVACLPGPDEQPALERVDLATGSSLGLVPIGLPSCRRVRALELAFERVVVASDDDELEASLGALTRLRESDSGPLVAVEPAAPVVRDLVALSTPQALCTWNVPPASGPVYAIQLQRPLGGGVAQSIGPLPEWSFPLAFAAGPRGLWVLSTDGVGDAYRFSHCALPAVSWTTWASYFDQGRPTAIAVEVGAHGERLCLATAGFYVPGFEIDPLLRLFDPQAQSFRMIPVGVQPESVRVVP